MPVSAHPERWQDIVMKTSEKVYTAISIVLCGFLVLGTANLILFILPKVEPDTANVFKVVCVALSLYSIALGATSFINLKAKQLLTTPTVVQIVVLFLSGYGIPFAIWGIILLIKRNNELAEAKPKPSILDDKWDVKT